MLHQLLPETLTSPSIVKALFRVTLICVNVVPIGKPAVEPKAAASAPADKLAIFTACEPLATVVGDEQAEEVHAFIRKLLGELFTDDVAAQIRIQYGGSVKPGNAEELLGQPNIDGALVGGASLKAEDFLGIINAG